MFGYEGRKRFAKNVNASGHISVTPMPDSAELQRYYAEVYYQQPKPGALERVYPADELDQKRMRARVLIRAVEEERGSAASEAARFLDIGCGEGFVLAAALESGYSAEAIDFSKFGLSSFHPELLPRLKTGDAESVLDGFIARGETFSVCSMQNVLEHVIDPAGLLRRVTKILRPDGIIVVTVPNDFSRLQEKAAELNLIDREYWFAPPDHLHYFNVDTLTVFLNQNGFQLHDAYADFPIEMFLFHKGSNYVLDHLKGKDAHRARITLDLLLAERGLDRYLALCRALTGCGYGRNVTAIARAKSR